MAKKVCRRRIALAITGASGVVYGRRVLEELAKRDAIETHLMLSPSAQKVLMLEDELDVDLESFDPATLGLRRARNLVYHHYANVAAPPASGSYRIEAMAIVPCSMGCAGAIAHGISDNLIERAADVMIKERRPLIVVPRETPLSTIHLKNLLALSKLGVTVMPASPGFYGKPKTISALVDFVVARVLDHLKVEHDLAKRWGE